MGLSPNVQPDLFNWLPPDEPILNRSSDSPPLLDDQAPGSSGPATIDFFWDSSSGQYRRELQGNYELPSLARAESLGQSYDKLRKAQLMAEAGLTSKAQRQAACGLVGKLLQCSGCPAKYYRPFSCRNRYCEACGHRLFNELLAKHLRRLSPVTRRLTGPGRGRRRVVAKVDFTTINLGRMPTRDEVREFNDCIKRFFRSLERKMKMSRQDYGVAYCDEFGGSDNTNLHAHGVYVGPVLPRQWFGKGKLLSEMWRKACAGGPFAGSFIISMKVSKWEIAVAHALKYAGKFLSRDPERLAELEVVFHGVRRVHALAAFYLRKEDDPKQAVTPSCPHCGAGLIEGSGWLPMKELLRAGCQDLDKVAQELRRQRVLTGPVRGSPWD